MSRAFIKESEAPEPVCPPPRGCGGRGVPVPALVVVANLGETGAGRLGSEAYFCPDPLCQVAYFDATGGRAGVAELRERRWPKDPAAPLCACFRVAEEEIAAWAREGRTDRMREFLERVRSGAARCSTATHDGRSCEAAARRVFMSERGN